MKEGSVIHEADSMLSSLFSEINNTSSNSTSHKTSTLSKRMSGAELIQFAYLASEREWKAVFKELVSKVAKRHSLGKPELEEITELGEADIVKAPTELARDVGLSFRQIEVVKHARQESARNFMEREILPSIKPQISLDELMRSRAARGVTYEFKIQSE